MAKPHFLYNSVASSGQALTVQDLVNRLNQRQFSSYNKMDNQ